MKYYIFKKLYTLRQFFHDNNLQWIADKLEDFQDSKLFAKEYQDFYDE